MRATRGGAPRTSPSTVALPCSSWSPSPTPTATAPPGATTARSVPVWTASPAPPAAATTAPSTTRSRSASASGGSTTTRDRSSSSTWAPARNARVAEPPGCTKTASPAASGRSPPTVSQTSVPAARQRTPPSTLASLAISSPRARGGGVRRSSRSAAQTPARPTALRIATTWSRSQRRGWARASSTATPSRSPAAVADGVVDRADDGDDPEGLRHVGHHAERPGARLDGGRVVRGDHDGAQLRVVFPHERHELQPGHPGEVVVDDDDVVAIPRQPDQRRLGAVHHAHLVAGVGEHPLEQVLYGRLVVDHEDTTGKFGALLHTGGSLHRGGGDSTCARAGRRVSGHAPRRLPARRHPGPVLSSPDGTPGG